MIDDGLTLDEKREMLRELKRARYSGALRVKFNDRDVTYKSEAEMQSAIKALENELAPGRSGGVLLTTFGSGV